MTPPSASCGGVFIDAGFQEVIFPSLWEADTFLDKIGVEKERQMWTFKDRGDRNVCLIPEVTGIVQEMWRNEWSRGKGNPDRIFYVSRCYRYERPQRGRYREFTQFGIEMLGDANKTRQDEARDLLQLCLTDCGVDFTLNDNVKRGIGYYVQGGFEAEALNLGSQKQIAGGGTYPEGCGWAIGIDRLLLAKYG
ncbi:hypothetical protein TH5_02395 [Thalassospira xianhensis MCCC 1A02616]|uniref:Histidine--tRNA ligase n=1 Tax=Thalassospira xianhensis MCCC 1A02616 TaxID=1177929 RepID=A0A367UI75_9PROT|nr:hypothetical protein TH5_02395 [Thalassospira xianhensis MCCC 1A02616]